MIMHLIIFIFLLAIVASLGSASYYLLHFKKGIDHRMVKALTLRISFSVGLFLLLMFAFWMGWLTPHGL